MSTGDIRRHAGRAPCRARERRHTIAIRGSRLHRLIGPSAGGGRDVSNHPPRAALTVCTFHLETPRRHPLWRAEIPLQDDLRPWARCKRLGAGRWLPLRCRCRPGDNNGRRVEAQDQKGNPQPFQHALVSPCCASSLPPGVCAEQIYLAVRLATGGHRLPPCHEFLLRESIVTSSVCANRRAMSVRASWAHSLPHQLALTVSGSTMPAAFVVLL